MQLTGRVVKSGLGASGAALLLALCGCAGFFVPQNNNGSTTTTNNTGDYVYVANANPSSASVGAFSVSSTGTLTTLSGSPYSLTFIPTALAVSPNNSYLFVGGTTGLYIYSIASNGALTLLSNAGASIPVASIAISPDGNYLFVLQSNVITGTNTSPTSYSVTVDEYSIASTGTLTLVATPAYTTTSGTFTPQQILVSPNGGYVMAALGSVGDIVFTLSSGTLSNTVQVISLSTLSSDNALAFDSTSTHVYVARSGVSGGLVDYSVASGGVLAQVGTTLGPTGNQPVSVVLDSTGSYAYVANRGDGTITALSISSSAAPTALSGPFASGTNPLALGLDNSHKYVLAVSSGGSPDLEVYSVGSSGALTSTATSTTGSDPTLATAIALTH